MLAQLKTGGKEIVDIKSENVPEDKVNRLMNIYGPKKKDHKTDQTLVIDREWLEQEMINNDETEPFEIDM